MLILDCVWNSKWYIGYIFFLYTYLRSFSRSVCERFLHNELGIITCLNQRSNQIEYIRNEAHFFVDEQFATISFRN